MNATASSSRYFALIPCAGNGSRAGTAGPKQYERVGGQPMVWHTLSAFAGVKRIARTLVVVAPGDGFFERNPTTSALVVPCGGPTRAVSVANDCANCGGPARSTATGSWCTTPPAASSRPAWSTA